ncbi:hypothetical protein ACFLYB_07160, partial [Chloroflexota bacterium]
PAVATFINFITSRFPLNYSITFLYNIQILFRVSYKRVGISRIIMQAMSKQRIYAFLLTVGASILVFKTLRLMFIEQGLEILVFWVIILTVMELLVDISCIIGSLRWLITNDVNKATLALKLGAAAAIFHAIRVLIYVLARTGPWHNFDVKPIYHSSYSFEWFWVWFAAILAILGVIGLIVIWRLRSRAK